MALAGVAQAQIFHLRTLAESATVDIPEGKYMSVSLLQHTDDGQPTVLVDGVIALQMQARNAPPPTLPIGAWGRRGRKSNSLAILRMQVRRELFGVGEKADIHDLRKPSVNRG